MLLSCDGPLKMIKAFMNIEKPNTTILTVISILDAFSDANKMAIFIKTSKRLVTIYCEVKVCLLAIGKLKYQ